MDAIDDLGDAIDVTRNRLTPVRTGTWLRLALIVFFVSSLGLSGPMIPSGDTGMVTDDPTVEEQRPQELEGIATDELVFWALVVVAIVLVLWLLYEFIAAIMEFVFLESLRSSEVHVRRYFAGNFGKGLWLFLFRLGLRVLFAVLGIVPAAALLLSMESGINGILAGLFLLYLLYALVLVVFYSVVMRFTTEFVTPTMLLTDRGVLDGWSRFWPTMKANWSDYGVYLLLVWILQFVVGIAASFVIGFAGVLLAIPFGIVIFLLVVAFDTVGLLLAVLLAIVGFVLFLVLASLLYVPIATYFRYYALLLLGDTDADLDLIPDRRGAVRGGGPVDGSDHGDGPVNGGDRGDGDGPSGFGAAESDSDRSSNRDDTGGWNDTSDWGDTGRQDDEADDTEYRDERDRPGDRDEDDDYGW